MSLNDISLLKYTFQQNKTPAVEARANINVATVNVAQTSITVNANSENEISVNSVGATVSDENLEEIYSTAEPPKKEILTRPTISVELVTTVDDVNKNELQEIKQLIFEHHFKPNKTSFIADTDINGNKTGIVDTNTLFDYVNSVNDEISKYTGITKAQLWSFTQNDDWEDSHNDFFGSINRNWQELDSDTDGTLTYRELKNYIGNEIGTKDNYDNKVETYSQIIQEEYEKKSDEDKLKHAIDLARDYCEIAGLTYQIEALDRLLSQENVKEYDGYVAQMGNIAISTQFEENVLGGYTASLYPYEYKTKANNTKHSQTSLMQFDDDSNGYDCGITLNAKLLEGQWYELVNTLVHELTHATAYKYSGNGKGIGLQKNTIPYSIIQDLYSINVLSEKQKKYYEDNWEALTQDDKMDLIYYSSCAWGEYAAYQADADFNDSIGRDVYNKNDYYSSATTVDGKYEANSIRKHIENDYNSNNKLDEPLPDYKWWTYAGTPHQDEFDPFWLGGWRDDSEDNLEFIHPTSSDSNINLLG